MSVMYSYSELIIKELHKNNMEFVLLTLFVVITSVLTLIEEIYKSGNLLFNCKDDNLLYHFLSKKYSIIYQSN